MKEVNTKIAPFVLDYYEGTYTLTLDMGVYKQKIFDKRKPEPFLGNGYDWESLAMTFIKEDNLEGEFEDIEFDSEAGMFCACFENVDNAINFSILFKTMCENEKRMQELVNKSEEL